MRDYLTVRNGILAFAYLAPAMLAFARRNEPDAHPAWRVLILNLLLGWTIISDGTSQPDHTINAHVIVPAGGFAVLGRGADVTPDNTVMSTQIADLRLVEKNHGSVRDATTRGWVPRLMNIAGGPF